MKRSVRVLDTVSRAAALLAAAGLIGLSGCGGGEVQKKAALPAGPAEPTAGAPAFPKADEAAAKNVGKAAAKASGKTAKKK